MSWEGTKTGAYKFTCDWEGCTATILSDPENPERDIKYLLPPEWSGMLLTSMGDGDYAAILCTTHAALIAIAVRERMRDRNGLVVGY